jgi:hypothetical protein
VLSFVAAGYFTYAYWTHHPAASPSLLSSTWDETAQYECCTWTGVVVIPTRVGIDGTNEPQGGKEIVYGYLVMEPYSKITRWTGFDHRSP